MFSRCPRCGTQVFIVERWIGMEHCPRCGIPLAQRTEASDPRAVEVEVQRRLYGGSHQRENSA